MRLEFKAIRLLPTIEQQKQGKPQKDRKAKGEKGIQQTIKSKILKTMNQRLKGIDKWRQQENNEKTASRNKKRKATFIY